MVLPHRTVPLDRGKNLNRNKVFTLARGLDARDQGIRVAQTGSLADSCCLCLACLPRQGTEFNAEIPSVAFGRRFGRLLRRTRGIFPAYLVPSKNAHNIAPQSVGPAGFWRGGLAVRGLVTNVAEKTQSSPACSERTGPCSRLSPGCLCVAYGPAAGLTCRGDCR